MRCCIGVMYAKSQNDGSLNPTSPMGFDKYQKKTFVCELEDCALVVKNKVYACLKLFKPLNSFASFQLT